MVGNKCLGCRLSSTWLWRHNVNIMSQEVLEGINRSRADIAFEEICFHLYISSSSIWIIYHQLLINDYSQSDYLPATITYVLQIDS